jgi:chromosome segregation protein
MNEMERVDQRINEADLILKERENSLKDLKKDRDDALEYKDLSEKIKRNKATHLHKQIARKAKELEDVLATIAEYKGKYGDLDGQIDAQKKLIQESRDTIEKINHELQVKGTKEQSDLQRNIQECCERDKKTLGKKGAARKRQERDQRQSARCARR